ncbi:MAG: hypothetical protein ABXS91_10860 [Sulfurimonas sp.]
MKKEQKKEQQNTADRPGTTKEIRTTRDAIRGYGYSLGTSGGFGNPFMQ